MEATGTAAQYHTSPKTAAALRLPVTHTWRSPWQWPTRQRMAIKLYLKRLASHTHCRESLSTTQAPNPQTLLAIPPESSDRQQLTCHRPDRGRCVGFTGAAALTNCPHRHLHCPLRCLYLCLWQVVAPPAVAMPLVLKVSHSALMKRALIVAKTYCITVTEAGKETQPNCRHSPTTHRQL